MMIKHKLEYFGYKLLLTIFQKIGIQNKVSSARIIATIFFSLLKIRKNVVIKNLSMAFPSMSKNEIELLAFKHYQSVAITFLEIFNIPKFSKDQVNSYLELDQIDLIKSRITENKGLIFLTAHFGNWELGAISTGIKIDDQISVLVKKQKNKYVAEELTKIREQFGNKEVSLGVSIRELYLALKNKKTVGIVGDQRGPRDGIEVNFFGQKTKTFGGTAAIAIKLNCPVVVLLCARELNGKYKSFLKEIEVSNLTGTAHEKIQEFNQIYMSFLESTIREYPEQWFWMHNIWKY